MSRGPAKGKSPELAAHQWTFLTNHAHVLICIAGDREARIRDIARSVGITERAVARILAELEADGYVERERDGRRNHYKIRSAQPLRHPLEEHRTVGTLIKAIVREDTKAR